MNYAMRRKAIYGPLLEEGVFTWPDMYGKEYALASCHSIDQSFLNELAFASQRLGDIFAKTASIVRQGDDALLTDLAIPTTAFSAVRLAVMEDTPTLIGRFDFVRTPLGLKMLEFNADTPGGIVEAYFVNGRVCHYLGLPDPNARRDSDLKSAFSRAVSTYANLGFATDAVVFSSLEWHEEDAGTTRYLLQKSDLPGRFVPLKDLRLMDDRLYALEGNDLSPVDLLYRLHPLGILAGEMDADGYPTGAHVLDLTSRRKLALINQPGALICQTKALQALIWNLAASNEFFTPQEREIITAYMLPTYLENRFSGRCPHCIKPVFGREGGAVILRHADGSILEKDADVCYWEQPMVYQEFAEIERLTIETQEGDFTGHLIWGAFLIDGHASAINARLGGRITNDMSYFLPICLTG